MWRTIAVLAVVSLAACGCGGEASTPDDVGDASADASEPPASFAPATTDPSPEQAVLSAYQAYWDTWLAANDPPDPDHPGIARYYAGAARERARDSITTNRTLGHAVRLPPATQYAHEARVVDVTDRAATVLDCAIDDSRLVVQRDGTILNDDVLTSRARATLQLDDDVWRVVDVTVLDRWQGVVPCVA
jgi:hypothetical protein